MEKNKLSYLLILFGLIFLFITSSISLKYKEKDDQQCKLEMENCPHENYYPLEFYLGVTFSLLLIGLGIYEKFHSNKKIQKMFNPSSLKGDEKLVYSIILENEGAIFQNELVEKSGFTRVKITRILDKLEGKGLIVRKRRGMTNIVILKNIEN